MSMKNKILLGLAVGLLATATTIPAMAADDDADVEFNWGAPASAGQADSTRKLSEAPSLPDDPEGKGDVSDDEVPALEEDELEVAGAAAGILPPAVSRSEIARVVVDEMRPRVKQLQDEHRLELATAAKAATARIEALQRQLIDLSSSFSGALKSVTKLAAGFNGALSGVKTVKEAQEKGPLLVSNASIITSKYERMLAAAVQPQGGPDAAELERKAQEEALDQPKGPSAADQAAAEHAAAVLEHERRVGAARQAAADAQKEVERLTAEHGIALGEIDAADGIVVSSRLQEPQKSQAKTAKKQAQQKATAAEAALMVELEAAKARLTEAQAVAASAAPQPPEAKPEPVEDDGAAARAAEQKRLRQQRNAAAAEERRLEDERRRGTGGSEDDADAKARRQEADRKKREQQHESEQATKKADKLAADKLARAEKARKEEARAEKARKEEARKEEARKEEARKEEARKEEELQNSSTKVKRPYRGGES